jgi:5-hydroxyisourate hydrolase
MSPITTHVLDTARGRPASGVAIVLETAINSTEWVELGRGRTDTDGRLRDLLPAGAALQSGTYRLRFATREYFAALGVPSFYPEVVVMVQIDDPGQHYHIPLLLCPFGYSTYRGT